MEIWKSIKGYEGLYEVSNFGKIKSLDRLVRHKKESDFRIQKGAIKKQPKNSDGYLTVILYLKNKQKSFLVHRLVCYHFKNNPQNKPTVNHKDGNKLNNHINNLEWNTISENTKHAWETGLIKKKSGDSCNNRKLSSLQVSEIKNLLPNNTHLEISKMYNVSRSTISAVSNGQNWKCL